MSPILHALEHEQASFSQMERRLAERILASPEKWSIWVLQSWLSSAALARLRLRVFARYSTSRAFPISKLSWPQKLPTVMPGRRMAAPPTRISWPGTLSLIVEAMQANHLASIRDTTSLLDLERLQGVIALLCNARRVDLYGMATSSIVAQDFYQKLVRIGVNCTAFADSHMQITSASSLAKGDVAFAISYSGETPETIDALGCAKHSGASTISLTSYGSSTLATLADIPLFSSSLEQGMRRGDMASRICAAAHH